MPRSVPEWIGRTPDSAPPDRVRVRVFERYHGVCQLCMLPIQRAADHETDHRIAVINGGENRENNLQPAHALCHAKKTDGDVELKAKSYRIRRRIIVGKRPRRPFRGWRRFNGDVVIVERKR